MTEGPFLQKFHCLPVVVILIVIGERYVPAMVGKGGTRQNFLVAKKIRSDSQLKSPTPPPTIVLTTYSALRFILTRS